MSNEPSDLQMLSSGLAGIGEWGPVDMDCQYEEVVEVVTTLVPSDTPFVDELSSATAFKPRGVTNSNSTNKVVFISMD